MPILLGVNAFDARGAAAKRQADALASWRALSGVRLANLQWPDEVYEVEGFATHAALRLDSNRVARRKGFRKPVVSEAFDRLAEIAAAEGCRWFGFANSDVHVTQAAVDRVVGEGREAYAFSRMDFDGETGEALGIETAGIDAFVVSVEWWRADRRRFRPYIAGEPIWDNVFTAILLAHAGGLLENRVGLVRHERHAAGAWGASPFAQYLRLLAALDAPYFSLWARYHARLTEMRARGASAEEEAALQRDAFRWSPGVLDRAVQAGRGLKAHLRYRALHLAGR